MAQAAKEFTGRLADPEFRKERARKASAARNSVDSHIKALVAAAPPLTESQKDQLRALLGADS